MTRAQQAGVFQCARGTGEAEPQAPGAWLWLSVRGLADAEREPWSTAKGRTGALLEMIVSGSLAFPRRRHELGEQRR